MTCSSSDAHRRLSVSADHLLWQNPYVQPIRENPIAASSTSALPLRFSPFNRNADEGYSIGRIFINRERRYFVEARH